MSTTKDNRVETSSNVNKTETESKSGRFETLAAVAGNVLEWYDFAVFGYFADILAEVFFPKQEGSKQLIESFAVFGGAFLMRPLGGIIMGWIGDKYGRKRALEISVFLMAFPTFAMGCLPTYDQVGSLAFILLILVRLFQGLSVGGQLMSSVVFTLEKKPKAKWGLYGSYVLVATNFGGLMGSLVGAFLRSALTEQQLYRWGWRLPFLSGIMVAFCGHYLKEHCQEEMHHEPPKNPLAAAFAKENRRSLLSASLVPMLSSAGFYLTYVWLPIFMKDLIDPPVPHAFWIASSALFLSACLTQPMCGWLSDFTGRFKIMVFGIILCGSIAPLCMYLIGLGDPVVAFLAQASLGSSLSFYAAPKIAWMMESFPPEVRLTSMSIGYNAAQAVMGGLTPGLATILVERVGKIAPGIYLSCVAVISLFGLVCVSPRRNEKEEMVTDDGEGNLAAGKELA
mmetsp:Transcript_10973/g.15696  ORF Transcript_10973/g.15696 Transcript_10973/m.15696 type:complete len:453 (+) Transcript_10973:58-1416(+)